MSVQEKAERAYAIYVSLMRARGQRVSRPWDGLLVEEQGDWKNWVRGQKPYYLVLPGDVDRAIRLELETAG